MSRTPAMNYGYAARQNYYMEEPDPEPEEYLAEYSDSEGMAEGQTIVQNPIPHSNITEIYSRKSQNLAHPQHHQQLVANDVHYHQVHPNQKQYVAQQCYYENVRQVQRSHMPVHHQEYMYDPRVHQYCPMATASQHDTNYDSAAYRSAHHELVNQHRNYPDVVHAPAVQKQPAAKRYPITVGTPKYYRKPQANPTVFKRPSALCLPVASQPDPAVYRRPRRAVATETQYGYQPVHQISQHQDIGLQHQQMAQQIVQPDITYTNEVPSNHRLKRRDSGLTPHKIDSGGDVNVKIGNLEDMLDSFEKDSDPPKRKSKTDMVKFARYLKPKVPASIKARQERIQRMKTMKDAQTVAEKCAMGDAHTKNSNEDSEREVTPDSLEKLLNQLKKCELVVGKTSDPGDAARIEEGVRAQKSADNRFDGDRREGNVEKPDVTDEEHKKQSTSGKSPYKSFNYQDITNQMLRSHNESKSYGDSAEESTVHSSVQDITKRITASLSDSSPHRPRIFSPKPPLDDNCALELHRSKSYIVNLIDRALSKELGTVPSERRKEFENMNPRKAINVMNRHTGLCDKELCLEITSALTDSIISSATAPDTDPPASTSKSKVCCCNAEEPTYIKQLKQLRWGHLKHIQREVRRLEDLERFLDACSLNTISEL